MRYKRKSLWCGVITTNRQRVRCSKGHTPKLLVKKPKPDQRNHPQRNPHHLFHTGKNISVILDAGSNSQKQQKLTKLWTIRNQLTGNTTFWLHYKSDNNKIKKSMEPKVNLVNTTCMSNEVRECFKTIPSLLQRPRAISVKHNCSQPSLYLTAHAPTIPLGFTWYSSAKPAAWF